MSLLLMYFAQATHFVSESALLDDVQTNIEKIVHKLLSLA